MQDEAFEAGENKRAVDDNSELLRRFAEWDSRVLKLINLASDVSFFSFCLGV